MPDLTGKSLRQALALLGALDVDVAVAGRGLVVRQTPAPGTPLGPGASCRLELAPPAAVRPATSGEPPSGSSRDAPPPPRARSSWGRCSRRCPSGRSWAPCPRRVRGLTDDSRHVTAGELLRRGPRASCRRAPLHSPGGRAGRPGRRGRAARPLARPGRGADPGPGHPPGASVAGRCVLRASLPGPRRRGHHGDEREDHDVLSLRGPSSGSGSRHGGHRDDPVRRARAGPRRRPDHARGDRAPGAARRDGGGGGRRRRHGSVLARLGAPSRGRRRVRRGRVHEPDPGPSRLPRDDAGVCRREAPPLLRAPGGGTEARGDRGAQRG